MPTMTDREGYSRTKHAVDTWEATFRAVSVMLRSLDHAHVWKELTLSEYDVLFTLSRATVPMRLRELNCEVMLSQPALSRLVDRLVDRGLVSRCQNASDGRAIAVSITPEGLAVQRTVGRRHVREIAQRIQAALSDDEQETLQQLAKQLTAAVAQIDGDPEKDAVKDPGKAGRA